MRVDDKVLSQFQWFSGAFGALGARYRVLADIGFANDWSFNDWKGGAWKEHIEYWKIATYEPLESTVRARAEKKYSELDAVAKTGLSPEAEGLLLEWRTRLSGICDAVDKNSGVNDFFGNRSDALNRERAELLTSLNNAIKELQNITIPAPVMPEQAPAAGGSTGSSSGGSGGVGKKTTGRPTSAWQILAEQARTAAAETKPTTDPYAEQAKNFALQQQKKPNEAGFGGAHWIMVGAAVIGVASLAYAFKKGGSPKAMAGYSKRRRRSRRRSRR